jgi:site-specific recombinase XerD
MLPHIDDFLQNLRVKDYSVSTVHNYEQYLAVFARFLDETNIPFDKISRQSIASYKTYLAGGRSGAMPSTEVAAKLSPCTVNYKLAGLRTYLRYLIDIDYPCPLAPEIVKNLKSLPKRPQLPRFEDLIKLIEMPRHDANIVERRDKAILEILFNTGLKVSELVGLNRERVDLQRKRLHLKGKGQETRTVFLPDNTVHWIAHY